MGFADQLYKLNRKCHQARSIAATLRRAKLKNVDKKILKPSKIKISKENVVLKISYIRYIKSFIELGQLQQTPRQ